MELTDQPNKAIRFGVFEVDPHSRELRKAGIRIRLQDQPFKVLMTLLECPGEVVSREELRSRIWPNESFGDFDHAVNVAVAKLRAALGDSAEIPRYVETLPRRGYRFLAPVISPGGVSADQHDPQRSRRSFSMVIALGIVSFATVAYLTLPKWFSRSKSPEAQNITIKRLTPGGNAGPSIAISPDGRYVAYARYIPQNHASTVSLLQIATNTEVQLPEAMGPLILGLTFSPDGNYLYIMRNDQFDPMTHHLFRAPALGGRPEHLLIGVDTPVSFSPDGRDFAYTRDDPKREAIELRRASADGSNDRLIATINGMSELYASGGAAWSPDGSTICLPVERVDKQDRWAMQVVSVTDGKLHELFSSRSFIGRPTWQPDGMSLIVGIADGPADLVQLWTASFPEGKLRRLTNGLTDYGFRPDVSRDGRTLATASMTYDSSLWSVPRSNPLAAKLINSNLRVYEVANGSDGRIFAVALDGSPWVMDVDGSHAALFTKFHNTRGIRVCGRFVVFLSLEQAGVQLLRVNPDGSNATVLAFGALSSVDCSSRGEFAYYLDTRAPAKISRVSIEGDTPTEVGKVLGENTSGVSLISVSPDGKYLAYTYDETAGVPKEHLAVVPSTGGAPLRIFEDPLPGLVRWSPDSKNLDYVDEQYGVFNIWEQPLAGGARKQLTKFTTVESISDFTWSAQGDSLLVVRDKSTSDIVLIGNLR